jgi:acetoin utilization protein AcuB
MRGEELVGIVTETDIFKVFMELMGARDSGVRISVMVTDKKGVLASVAGAVANAGYNIISLGTFWGEDGTSTIMTFKVQGVSEEKLEELVKPLVTEVLDVRTT